MLLLILSTLINLVVIPGSCFAPCNFRVTLLVTPAADNSMVVLEVSAPESSAIYYRSYMEYGPRSPKRVYITYSSIPAGKYTVTATLYKRHDGKVSIAGSNQKQVNVVGEDTELTRRGINEATVEGTREKSVLHVDDPGSGTASARAALP